MYQFDQPISKEIFFKKSALHNETSVEEILKAVADKIASNEKDSEYWSDIFYNEMINNRLIPGGRILANAKSYSKIKNYSNCFVVDIEDSMENIYDTLKETALISKQGGGWGLNISKLRPKNDNLSIGGQSSGPLSFMKIFNESGNVIMTGGSRRSAILIVLNVDHPDIEEFINCKKGDVNKAYQRMNISVGITDDFIIAVENDLDWNLVFDDKIYKTIKAKELYNKLVENAFNHNEPGILNLDTINKYNNAYYAEKINSTNPCFTGDTLIAVAGLKDPVTIKNLAEDNKEFLIYSARKNNSSNKKRYWKPEIKKAKAFKTGYKKIIELTLNNGDKIKCTSDHLLALNNGGYIEAEDSINKSLNFFFMYGGKNKKHLNINSFTNAHSKQHRMIYLYHNKVIPKNYIVHHLNYENDCIQNLQCISKRDHDDMMRIERLKENNSIHKVDKKYLSFLTRKMSYGSKNGNSSGITNLEIIELAKKLKECGTEITITNLRNLDNRVPQFWSKYRFNKSIENLKDIVNNNISYQEPIISNMENPNKIKINKEFFKSNIYVTNIEELGFEEVYDITVEDNHNFYIITNTENNINYRGLLVHNCGEIPLIPYSACNLASINLTSFIKNPFTNEAKFNWIDFKETIKIGVRFLDNVVDVTEMPLPKINDKIKRYRQCGLGITGLADCLAMLQVIYGSDDSKHFVDLIGSILRDTSYETSVELAIEKGVPDGIKDNINELVKSNFIIQLPIELQEKIKINGLRNITLNTLAPTGTTSLTLGQNCSSGIEPIFNLFYERTILVDNDNNTKKETVYDYAYLKWLEDNKDKKIPNYFVTTSDIEPRDAIDIQSILQKYIDNSISKTCNLKSGTTFDEYSDLFLYAYKKGLKGFTTFNPDGSIRGIINYSKKENVERQAIERPNKILHHIHKVTIKGEKWIVFVGIVEDKPYEVFAGKIDSVDIPSKIDTVYLIKKGKGIYSIEYDNEIIIKDLNKVFGNLNHEAITRLLSTSLRHNVPLKFIIEQINKSKGEFSNFEKCIARALKKYIKDGESSSDVCPECGIKLIYKEGCLSCTCGFSKCG
jgi:ribonucleoside-diphosphate reductase alpha chain